MAANCIASLRAKSSALVILMLPGSPANTPRAMISWGVSGIRAGALIVNLPGSPKAVRESFAVIEPVLHHAIGLLQGTSSSHDE